MSSKMFASIQREGGHGSVHMEHSLLMDTSIGQVSVLLGIGPTSTADHVIQSRSKIRLSVLKMVS